MMVVSAGISSDMILGSFPHPVLVLDEDDAIRYVNPSAEHFFACGASQLCRDRLSTLLPFGSPVQALVNEARQKTTVISEYGLHWAAKR